MKLKNIYQLALFLGTFSVFFFPTLLYAQSATPWSFYNNPLASNAMDIFYNGVGAANPAVRIKTGGNVGIGTTTPNARLSFVNNVGTGFLDSYGEYQILLWDGGAAASAYGLGIKSNTMVFNSGGAYSFDRAGAATTMTLESNGNVGIGTSSPNAKLEVRGNASVSGGALWANDHANLAAGALNIGNYTTNFGGGSGWTTNTAGLMLETLDNTEIAVHDAGTRAASLMYYQGGATNSITIGRNMGWDAVSSIILNGNVSITGTFSPTNMSIPGTFTAANGGYNINSAGTSRFADIKTRTWNTAGGSSLCMGPLEPLGVGTIGVCSSDIRLKKNIRYFQTPILDQVLKLKPALFDVRDNSRMDVPGFIAQDVQQVFPESVIDKGNDQMLQFSSEQLVPYLTKAIQELSTKIDAQQKEIELLKQKQSQ